MSIREIKYTNVSESDASGMLEIYSPFITDSVVSFETEVPSETEFASRIKHYTEKYPWIKATNENGKIVGYTYASTYRERAAYRFCCEVSVYVHNEYQKQGIAEQLYLRLLNELESLNIRNVYAVIALPNENSVGFHAKMGFESFAIFKKVGFKFDKWIDVQWMVKFLSEKR